MVSVSVAMAFHILEATPKNIRPKDVMFVVITAMPPQVTIPNDKDCSVRGDGRYEFVELSPVGVLLLR